MNNGFQRWGILLGVGFGIVVLDQITKALVMHTMHLHESIPIIAGFFNLTYIRNPGAAFGMFATTNSAFRLIFFAGTSIFALGLLGTIFYRMHPADVCGQLSVSAIFGGGDREPARPVAIRRSRGLSRLLHGRLPLAGLQRGGQRHHRGCRIPADPVCHG